ncbi:FAD-linked oxidoreductase azaL [Lasiodiplodia hormozganensis]|uniref:FAD-linked oxidoreductase azaL n=1 Tax=Lasiodiplodia hormozganensis TaxID=869390 RepID=A0AA39Y7B7_9PEZI|nr:FAD-linked oxidoreductase azaL [Lasiodiplodia hormozganensis]
MISAHILSLFSVVNLALAVDSATIQTYLTEHLSSGSEVVVNPTDLTERWNAYDPPTYSVGVKPATTEDVSIIVKYASNNSIPFLGTGGGHGYSTTTSALQNGLDIDLSGFNTVSVDDSASKMTIGGGVRFRDILDPVYAAGKEIQTGSCSCVGMVGATLGGGIGPYQGLHGLIIDALDSVTIVTGTGEIVNASATENTDLFWGLRGAGQNFGIITSATYTLHDQTNGGAALNADFLFAASENATIFQIIKDFAGNQPDALALMSVIQYSTTYNTTVILVNAIYGGPEEEGRKIIEPLINANALQSNVSMIPWNRLIHESRFGADALGCIAGQNQAVYGMNLYNYDIATYQATLDAYIDFYATTGIINAFMATEMFPTAATLETPDDATAYPYRDTMAYLLLSFGGFSTESQAAAITEFANQRRAELSKLNGDKGLEVYVNYARGDEGRNAWYTAEKLPKLESIKDAWDPNNLFNFTNGFTY